VLLRRFRTAATGLVLAAALLGSVGVLASCRTDPGVAAYVGDTRITTDRVDAIYDQANKDPASKALVAKYPSLSKQVLVGTLVRLELLRVAVKHEDLSVSTTEVTSLRQAIVAQRDQLQADDLVVPPALLAERAAYEQALGNWATRIGGTSAQVAKRFETSLRGAEASDHVSLNPRFGSFDVKTLSVAPAHLEGVAPAPSASPESPAAGTDPETP
jgi:hypothetical protein